MCCSVCSKASESQCRVIDGAWCSTSMPESHDPLNMNLKFVLTLCVEVRIWGQVVLLLARHHSTPRTALEALAGLMWCS